MNIESELHICRLYLKSLSKLGSNWSNEIFLSLWCTYIYLSFKHSIMFCKKKKKSANELNLCIYIQHVRGKCICTPKLSAIINAPYLPNLLSQKMSNRLPELHVTVGWPFNYQVSCLQDHNAKGILGLSWFVMQVTVDEPISTASWVMSL